MREQRGHQQLSKVASEIYTDLQYTCESNKLSPYEISIVLGMVVYVIVRKLKSDSQTEFLFSMTSFIANELRTDKAVKNENHQ